MKNRRDFLKGLMTLSVFSAACPHALLGKLVPAEVKVSDSGCTGNYVLDLNEYPDLTPVYGAVILNIPDEYNLNQIVQITHLDTAKYDKPYAAMNCVCPHMGETVGLLNPDREQIRCPRHGSLFWPDGTLKWSITTKLSLIKYDVCFDGDHTLYISLPFYVSVEDDGTISDKNTLKSVFPNPTHGNITVDYYLAREASIKITAEDINGQTAAVLESSRKSVGAYSCEADLSRLPAGVYFLRLTADGINVGVEKFAMMK